MENEMKFQIEGKNSNEWNKKNDFEFGKVAENSYKSFTCNLCEKHFRKKANLTVHLNSHNRKTNLSDYQYRNDEKEMDNVCSVCFKRFTAKKNLMKHLRNVHKNFIEADRMVVKKIKCPHSNCKFLCRMMKELRDHIERIHKVKVLKDTMEFPNESVFQEWKREEETNTMSWFVTGRKKTTLIDGRKKQILYCHRTGQYSPKGFGKYRMRSAGSCKIGVTCPASMEVVELSDGQLSVIYYKTHFGHERDLVYLKLSKEERANLAEKIKQGFTFDSILEDIKESIGNNDLKKKRIHLLSKKDLYSIMRSSHREEHKSMKKGNGKMAKKSMIPTDISTTRGDKQEVVEGFDDQKINRNIQQQNFTLYPGEGVILPQEYSSRNGSSEIVNSAKEISNLSQTSRDQISSQILIFSRDMNCTPVTEIILLSPTEEVRIPTKISPENGNENGKNYFPQTKVENPEDENTKKAKINLKSQLQKKLDRINNVLPGSEFLTPKEFALIGIKLDAIFDMLQAADARAKSKAFGKRKSEKKRKEPGP